MGIRCADHVTPLYPQKLTLTSPTGGGRSVGIVRSRTKATESPPPRSCVVLPSECEQANVATSCTFSHCENTVHHQSVPSDETGNQYYHREAAAASEGASPTKMPLTKTRADLAQAALRQCQRMHGPLLELGGGRQRKITKVRVYFESTLIVFFCGKHFRQK